MEGNPSTRNSPVDSPIDAPSHFFQPSKSLPPKRVIWKICWIMDIHICLRKFLEGKKTIPATMMDGWCTWCTCWLGIQLLYEWIDLLFHLFGDGYTYTNEWNFPISRLVFSSKCVYQISYVMVKPAFFHRYWMVVDHVLPCFPALRPGRHSPGKPHSYTPWIFPPYPNTDSWIKTFEHCLKLGVYPWGIACLILPSI